MKTSEHHSIHRTLDIRYEDLLPFFKGFSEGVIFVDRSGTIIYYNPAMAKIDELEPADVLGKKIVDVYDLTCGESLIMQCLKRKESIIDRFLLYRTRRGKVANTIHTVFPLFKRGRLEGAICLVREYNVLEETISSISIPRSKQLNKHSQAVNKELTDISENDFDLFHQYNWPGNVRELEHVIEGAINMVVSSRTIEIRYLQSHLTTCQGHITRAANELGISRQLFNYKMRKYSICREDFLV